MLWLVLLKERAERRDHFVFPSPVESSICHFIISLGFAVLMLVGWWKDSYTGCLHCLPCCWLSLTYNLNSNNNTTTQVRRTSKGTECTSFKLSLHSNFETTNLSTLWYLHSRCQPKPCHSTSTQNSYPTSARSPSTQSYPRNRLQTPLLLPVYPTVIHTPQSQFPTRTKPNPSVSQLASRRVTPFQTDYPQVNLRQEARVYTNIPSVFQ